MPSRCSVRVIEARDLPLMDRDFAGAEFTDAFVEVRFASFEPCRTAVRRTQHRVAGSSREGKEYCEHQEERLADVQADLVGPQIFVYHSTALVLLVTLHAAAGAAQ